MNQVKLGYKFGLGHAGICPYLLKMCFRVNILPNLALIYRKIKSKFEPWIRFGPPWQVQSAHSLEESVTRSSFAFRKIDSPCWITAGMSGGFSLMFFSNANAYYGW